MNGWALASREGLTVEEYIAELEEALNNAIWVSDLETRRLAWALDVTVNQASILLALYKARYGLTGEEVISCRLIQRDNKASTHSFSSVYILKIRQKLGRDIITTVWGSGYILTSKGRALVREGLAKEQA